jgi:hypothetical protein
MKIFKIISYITLTGTMVLMFYAIYLLIFPLKVMDIKNSNAIKTDQAVYKVGDKIGYTIEYCKYVSAPGTLHRTLVDEIVTTYPDFSSNLPIGCHTTEKKDLVVPSVSDGTYHLETTATHRVNILRTIETSWRSEDFQIVNPKTDEP